MLPREFAVAAALAAGSVRAFTYQQSGYWTASGCGDEPFYEDIFPEFNCGQRNITYNCSPYTPGNTTYYRTVICVEDTQMWTKNYYDDTQYVLMEHFDDSDCTSYDEGRAFLADGNCVLVLNSTTYGSAVAAVGSDGAVTLDLYTDTGCDTTAAESFSISSDVVGDHSCYGDGYKFYTTDDYTSGSGSYSGDDEGDDDDDDDDDDDSSSSAGSGTGGAATPASGGTTSGGTSSGSTGDETGSSDSNSGLGGGAIAGIVIGLFFLVVVGIILFRRCRRRNSSKSLDTNDHPGEAVGGLAYSPMYRYGNVGGDTYPVTDSTQSGELGGPLWHDEAILAVRIPREKVKKQQLISRGGYGEVYVGVYNGRRVAIKTLLPETRKSTKHMMDFLAEVKLMASLDHPRIVEFVGVAWDSPMDLCALLEFMDGGDLRALLNKYQDQHVPVEFTPEKVKIALHVAHALTYLHSLPTPVIHRDLKSRNILLNRDLDAKLTDFGVSRERADRTMTAAVGTSLWMAPEVLMGERYDDKADIYSFGVVLSELSSHDMPYAHAKSRDGSGSRMPDTAVLQLVATGKLRVDFSPSMPETLVELGVACVAVDPKARPSAAEVLYRLQSVQREG